MPLANVSAISGVVITAASGWPLPAGLPNVTMSGTTPCVSKPQKWLPTRPSPVCTSSAMQMPPAARTCVKRRGHEAVGKDDLPAAAHQRFADKARHAAALRLDRLDRALYVPGVGAPALRAVAAVAARGRGRA